MNDDDSVIDHINAATYEKLLDDGIISEGMLPKLNNCFHAIAHKVSKVCIGKVDILYDTSSKFTTITLD